jgi:uncharacterized membrane protein YkvA (DUF1232 family)
VGQAGTWTERARALKRQVIAIYFAARDPRTPWYAKALVAIVVAYALSPIDLIPDIIPILGQIDDLLLVPAGIWLALRLIPEEVMRECRARAQDDTLAPKGSAAVVAVTWAASLSIAALLIWRAVR